MAYNKTCSSKKGNNSIKERLALYLWAKSQFGLLILDLAVRYPYQEFIFLGRNDLKNTIISNEIRTTGFSSIRIIVSIFLVLNLYFLKHNLVLTNGYLVILLYSFSFSSFSIWSLVLYTRTSLFVSNMPS